MGGGQNPDADAVRFPKRPLSPLSDREGVFLRVLYVDPTAAEPNVVAPQVRDAELKGVSNQSLYEPAAIFEVTDEVALDIPFGSVLIAPYLLTQCSMSISSAHRIRTSRLAPSFLQAQSWASSCQVIPIKGT